MGRARGPIKEENKITKTRIGTDFKGGRATEKGKKVQVEVFGHKHGEGATVTKRN